MNRRATCLLDGVESGHGSLCVILVFVRMHEDGEASELLLDNVHRVIGVYPEDLVRVEIPVGGAGPQQAVDLLRRCQHRILLLRLLQVRVERLEPLR